MDTLQLKLLAARVRGLLDQRDVAVGHNQSLDLIAALAGLRNWPEVNAFPDRVAACELNANTAARLVHRLRSKHGVEFSAQSLVTALEPPVATAIPPSQVPTIWPSGPTPGVYVTTSQDAINALLKAYDESTDGELVYAEAAGSDWDGAIDLGDHGLSSNGLARVPSGTLIVVGPLELNQQSWESSASKLEWACLRAQCYGHRVAVLLNTPQPELLFADVDLAVRQVSPEDDDCYLALAGIVTEAGEMESRVPFVQPKVPPVVSTAGASTDALPANVQELLRNQLQSRSTGFLLLSSCKWGEHWGIEEVAAALPLTESVGPAARIKPRSRSTPAKDMMVPDLVKGLPFLASVESAYAHGYRRMLVDVAFTDLEVLLKYPDVLFFIGGHSMEVDEALVEAVRFRGFRHMGSLHDRLVACICVAPIATDTQTVRIADVYLPVASGLAADASFTLFQKHAQKHRAIRWEDELTPLLDAGTVTPEMAKSALENVREKTVSSFLAKWTEKRRAVVA